MSKFNRGISQDFVNRLNKEYAAGGWWKAVADDDDLFIAIREGYINVYYKGCSLLKLWQVGENLIGETNYKYLLRPDIKPQNVKFVDGKFAFDQFKAPNGLFISDFSDLEILKKSANAYASEEKIGVHVIVMYNDNLVDVEIAFSKESEQSEDVSANQYRNSSAKRIDFAALRKKSGSGYEIVFYEAKQFSNKGELRAEGTDVPVLRQLSEYQDFLTNNKDDLIKSYQTVCGNLASLNGIRERYGSERVGVMKEIAKDVHNLTISNDVRLVIFGYDEDQMKGKIWEPHYEKLKKAKDSHLLMKGDTLRFIKGISD